MEGLGSAAEIVRDLAREAALHFCGGQSGDGRAAAAAPAVSYIARGKVAEAIRESARLLASDPANGPAHLCAGIAAFKRGDLGSAERFLRRYLELQPEPASLAKKVRSLLAAFAAQRAERAPPRPKSGAQPAPAPKPILRVSDAGRAAGTVLNVNWVITQHCNFTCSYCTVYDNAARHPSLEQLQSAVDKIARLGRSEVKVVLTGGEPTIHPGYIPFLRYVAERLPTLSTLRTETNLSRTPRFYRELAEAMREYSALAVFHCSVHFEFTNLDKFLANARFLADHGFAVQVRLLAHPEHMAAVRRLARELLASRSSRFTLILKTVRRNFGAEPDDRYTADDLAWLSEVHDEEDIERRLVVEFRGAGPGGAHPVRQSFSPNELIALRLNRFKGMGCYAGVEMLSIDAAGRLDRAVCFRRAPGPKPNIYRDAQIPASYLRPVLCPFEACGCSEDIAITKVAVV